jgi:DNA-binding MarR family transcriptional regulator
MFVKIRRRTHASQTYEYVDIVESRRLDGRVVQKRLGSLGRRDQLTASKVDALIEHLRDLAAEPNPAPPAASPKLEPEPDRVDRIELAWRRERPEVDVSSIGIVTRLWRLARHFERERVERLAEVGTDRVAIDVLAMLRRAGPPYRRTAGELTRSSLITPGGVSQRLSRLERAGLVTRHVHPDDRRRVDVELTPSGMKLMDSVLADLMAHESALLARLSEEEQGQLRHLLRKLLAEFE